MKVVAFNGSPRAGGNTEQLIGQVFETLEAEGITCHRIDIARQGLRGCTACYGCVKNGGTCVLQDDLNAWVQQAYESDGVLIGSPTYFANVSAEAKALLDRMGLLGRITGRLRRKPLGAVIAVRRAGALPAFDAINHMAQINQMLIVGSTYWNHCIGREKGEVLQDSEGLENMKNLAENMAWLIRKLKS